MADKSARKIQEMNMISPRKESIAMKISIKRKRNLNIHIEDVVTAGVGLKTRKAPTVFPRATTVVMKRKTNNTNTRRSNWPGDCLERYVKKSFYSVFNHTFLKIVHYPSKSISLGHIPPYSKRLQPCMTVRTILLQLLLLHLKVS